MTLGVASETAGHVSRDTALAGFQVTFGFLEEFVLTFAYRRPTSRSRCKLSSVSRASSTNRRCAPRSEQRWPSIPWRAPRRQQRASCSGHRTGGFASFDEEGWRLAFGLLRRRLQAGRDTRRVLQRTDWPGARNFALRGVAENSAVKPRRRSSLLFGAHHAITDGVGGQVSACPRARACRGEQPDPVPDVDPLIARDLKAQFGGAAKTRFTRAVPPKTQREPLAFVDGCARGRATSPGHGFVVRTVPAEQRKRINPRRFGPSATLNDLLLASMHRAIESWNARRGVTSRRISTFIPFQPSAARMVQRGRVKPAPSAAKSRARATTGRPTKHSSPRSCRRRRRSRWAGGSRRSSTSPLGSCASCPFSCQGSANSWGTEPKTARL